MNFRDIKELLCEYRPHITLHLVVICYQDLCNNIWIILISKYFLPPWRNLLSLVKESTLFSVAAPTKITKHATNNNSDNFMMIHPEELVEMISARGYLYPRFYLSFGNRDDLALNSMVFIKKLNTKTCLTWKSYTIGMLIYIEWTPFELPLKSEINFYSKAQELFLWKNVQFNVEIIQFL